MGRNSAGARLDWNLAPGVTGTWDSGETISFFFRDPREPGMGNYNLINAIIGTASNYAPGAVQVPEPGTLGLLGAGLLGLAFARRRKAS